MEILQNVWDWVNVAFAVVGGLVVAATAVVKMTKTTKDDEFLAKFVSWVEKASVIKKNLEGTKDKPAE